MDIKKIRELITKYSLQNAIMFDGKCNPGSIVGKIIGECPEAKANMKEVMQVINDIVSKINLLTIEDQRNELKLLAPELLDKKKGEKRTGLKELKEVNSENFVVRIAPSPSGPLHIGHAYGCSLNYEYAKKYKGKLVVRIEDTNPGNIYEPAYDLIKRDCEWLTDNNVDEFYIQSSRLEIYYEYAKKLVDLGKAYVCTCDSDEWRDLKNKGIACPCRELSSDNQNERYVKMFSDYKEGEAVLRLKTDITHKNPAMRDFSLMRINEHIHPRTKDKYRVWPLMVLSVAIDDHLMGITHVLNGKDHADNAKKESLIMGFLGWKPPIYQHWGRINFEGFELSSSKTKIKIEQNEYDSWEDIRLPFLPALRRRGYQAGAFRKFALEIGLSQNDKKVEISEFWKNINTLNKQLIEKDSFRYFLVHESIKIDVRGAPIQDLELDLHPENKKGGRVFHTNQSFYISKEDYDAIKDMECVRLMDCLNIVKKGDIFEFSSRNYEDFKKVGSKIIHWLPEEGNVNVEVLMPDKKVISGYGEGSLSEINKGQIIQFERFGFCRFDKFDDTTKTYHFWFAHK